MRKITQINKYNNKAKQKNRTKLEDYNKHKRNDSSFILGQIQILLNEKLVGVPFEMYCAIMSSYDFFFFRYQEIWFRWAKVFKSLFYV